MSDTAPHAHTAEEALDWMRDEMRCMAGRIEHARDRIEFDMTLTGSGKHKIRSAVGLIECYASFLRALSLEVGAGLPGVRE